ncbi:MAG: PEGA domain-containing protein [Vicinamibacterales bacterium]
MAPNQGATAARVVERQASAPDTHQWGSDPASFGAFLRSQREARHLTVQQIADTTKIASRHFTSLERGDIRRWPGGMYRRAMVRAYAQAVGLNVDETVRRFLAVFPPEQDGPAVASPTPQPEVRRPAVFRRVASVTGIAGLSAVVILIGWNAVSYIRGAMQSDIVSTPPLAPAGESATVETIGPTLPNETPSASTPEATSGATEETIENAVAPTEGELLVESDPDGAQVTVNGVGWGRTPVTIKYLPIGEKRVRLTKDGYVSIERRIQISAERPVGALRVTLEPRAY